MVGLGSGYHRRIGADSAVNPVSCHSVRGALGGHRRGNGLGNSDPVDGRGRRLGSRRRTLRQQEPYVVNLQQDFKPHSPWQVSSSVVPDVNGISC